MILVDIFFDILISVGPFYIFKGMGTGKDSGKLLFRSLTSSNSSVIFSEDQNGLTFSSNATSENVPSIFLNNLIEGTGNCIKNIFNSPRKLLVDNRQGYESIVGVGKWNSMTQSSNFNNLPTVCNNIIVSGRLNTINSDSFYSPTLCHSVILGGQKNKIDGTILSQYGGPNLIVGGYYNRVCHGYNSSIIGGCCNSFTTRESVTAPISAHSTIISSSCTQLDFGGSSFVVTSTKNNLSISDGFGSTPSISSRLCNSNIMSSSKIFTNDALADKLDLSCEGESIRNAQILSSKNIFLSSFQDSVLSSTNSVILASSATGGQNLLMSTELGLLQDVQKSMILSSSDVDIKGCSKGSNNFIITSANSRIENCSDCCLRNNSVINSSLAYIFSCDLSPNCMKMTCGNSIISSTKACIYNSQNSMIMLSSKNSVAPFGTPSIFRDCNSVVSSSPGSTIFSTSTQTSKNNIVLGSRISCVELSCNSAIISSSQTELTRTNQSVIINSGNSSIRSSTVGNVDDNLIISAPKSGIVVTSNFSAAERNVVLSGCCNVIKDATDSSIIAGCENCLYDSKNATIIAGKCNVLETCCLNGNSIIGGYCNKISFKPTNAVIIAGYKNYIYGNTGYIGQSIIGGQCIENRIDRSTMVPRLTIFNSLDNPNRNVWMCGFTGSSGVFTVGSGSIKVCNGLVIGI